MAIQQQSNRVTSLVKLWESDEQSFSIMKREYGEPILRVALLKELSDISSLLGAELNKTQFNYLLDQLTTKYHYFTISDLTIIRYRMTYDKVFHKPSVQSFMTNFKDHDLERDEYAAMNQKKKQHEAKEETEKDIARFNENYKKMRRNAQKPKRSKSEIQKSKDKNLKRKREKQIKKMRDKYPDEMLSSKRELDKIDSDFIKKNNLENK